MLAIASGFFLSPFPWMPWCSISIIGALLHSDLIVSAQKIYDNFRPALFLLLSTIVGLIFSSDYTASLKGTMDFFRGFLAGAAILILLSNREGTKLLFGAATICLTTVFLIHLYAADSLLRSEAIFAMELDWFAHPARLGGICFLIMLSAIYACKNIFLENINLICLPIFLTFLQIELWASSRGPILCAFLAVALAISLIKQRKRAMAASTVALVAGAPIVLVLISQITQRGLSDSGRYELWKHTLSIWQESPWLGLGNNVFKQIPNQYLQGGQLQMPHNIYLEVLFSGGVFSFAAFMTSIAFIAILIRKNRQKIDLASAAAILFFFLLGLFDIKLFSSLAGFYFGLGTAMIVQDLNREAS